MNFFTRTVSESITRLVVRTPNVTDTILKLYFPVTGTEEQRAKIVEMIRRGPPSSYFAWPAEIGWDRSGRFGYMTSLSSHERMPQHSLPDLLSRKVSSTFGRSLPRAMGLADAFLTLHTWGGCLGDFSLSDFRLDPTSGAIVIVNFESIAIQGVRTRDRRLYSLSLMAPELVRGESVPSETTDLYLLAVVMFLILINHHPLEGARESSIHHFGLEEQHRLYGTDPLFIFDPRNVSNAPTEEHHRNALVFWPLYPRYIQRFFTRAFTDGLVNPPVGRITEAEWRDAMIRLRFRLLLFILQQAKYLGCRKRGDRSVLESKNQSRLPPRIEIRGAGGTSMILLNYDTCLYPHHLGSRPYDFTVPLASVVRRPDRPSWD